jgi:anti-anti-sigma factor
MASFEVTTEQARPGRLLVRLTGEFDLAAFEEVDTLLASAQTGGVHSLVVDLRGLQFIDSSGIKLLLRAQARAEELGGRLRVVRGSASIQHIFALTGLEGSLPFADEEGVQPGPHPECPPDASGQVAGSSK